MPTPLRPIHPDFQSVLETKDQSLVELYIDLRNFVLELYPETNELLYHTHALTSLFTPSEKMSDGFCHIPIYSEHLNLGFNEGTLLADPHGLLKGTRKLIRHVPVKEIADYRNPEVKALLQQAIVMALDDLAAAPKSKGKTISKIKKK